MTSTPRALSRWQSLAALLLALTVWAAPVLGQQSAATAAAPRSATTLADAEREAAALVSLETIREVTTALSSKEMEGRGTAQPGGERAAQYIAERFRKLGLKPLGDKGTYMQEVKFREINVLPESGVKVGEEALARVTDYVVGPLVPGEKEASGRVVFVAYGLISEVPKRDDFANIDVSGKIVLLVQGPPKGVSQSSWDKAKIQQDILINLVRRGASGIVIANAKSGEHPYEELADYMTRRKIELATSQELPSQLPPFVMVSDAGAEKFFAGSKTTYAEALRRAEAGEFVSQTLSRPAKLTVRLRKGKGSASNVVGLLEGSDPKLKEEAVVYTAHYDAYGKESDGRVYPGAADNALGVAEMLAIAEAFAKSPAPPRRSVIFLAVTGEEYGLLGAEHWVKNPTWKLKQVAANLNLDGIGTEVYGPVKRVVVFGAEHSDLGAIAGDVVAATGASVIPDPMPDEKSFYRSDHYEFVKKGVPAVMLMGNPDIETAALVARIKKWEKEDYHQPTDTVRADWSWEGARGIAVVGLVAGMRVANAEQMPAWLKSSPFNRPRGTNEPPPDEP